VRCNKEGLERTAEGGCKEEGLERTVEGGCKEEGLERTAEGGCKSSAVAGGIASVLKPMWLVGAAMSRQQGGQSRRDGAAKIAFAAMLLGSGAARLVLLPPHALPPHSQHTWVKFLELPNTGVAAVAV
jgi:hypothetical protein